MSTGFVLFAKTNTIFGDLEILNCGSLDCNKPGENNLLALYILMDSTFWFDSIALG